MREPQTIWDIKANPWSDEPRFYPPGRHPATYRYQETLARMQALGLEDSEHAAYAREQIAIFEEGENKLKLLYYRMIQDRKERL